MKRKYVYVCGATTMKVGWAGGETLQTPMRPRSSSVPEILGQDQMIEFNHICLFLALAHDILW